ncbi:MAG: YbaB/EbfC family nucleoid-associated protein [Candidatus Improbicoccus devescovinae]|nr:MAG: YbaB/EbfC family nucleoid-associated protein [Candidatus Improbicoccus devescovinae]
MKVRLPSSKNQINSGNFGEIAKQAQKIQKEMEIKIAELESKEFEYSSGGGAVKVIVNGKMIVNSILIKPEVLDKNEIDMLQDLIISAINGALAQVTNEKNIINENIYGNNLIAGLS